jgi:hypothetical protein
MAVTDISPNTVEQLSRKRLSFEGYVLIIGVIVVAALGIASGSNLTFGARV